MPAPDLSIYLEAIDAEMRAVIRSSESMLAPFYGMMHYHMGWADEQFRPAVVNSGKRLRPVFCLLAAETLGSDWRPALPAAAAVEILHNFSLVHDDIEDGDRTRRHRPTLWTLSGVPHAINAGDALFVLAQQALLRLSDHDVPAASVLRAERIFQTTCLRLVEGQFLDMQGESLAQTDLPYYERMISGKTAALLGASLALGAVAVNASDAMVADCQRFGEELGLAFQMTDDILGLWGAPAVTGKPAGADLKHKKKSLPVVLAQATVGELGDTMRRVFALPEVSDAEVATLLGLMDGAQIRQRAEQEANRHNAIACGCWQTVAGSAASASAAATASALAESLTRRTH
ncbi:MAG: polyprenyl synthetase family protein [Chloroflexi bacterium]|nr:polyprenyl synthetase family protein [Chloroflexota bacterium]